jgi:hypothetical protein
MKNIFKNTILLLLLIVVNVAFGQWPIAVEMYNKMSIKKRA